jgi:hypothetical protein
VSDLGKVVYDSFLHEAGFDKDARTVDFDKLASFQQQRWRTIADNVITAWKELNDRPPNLRPRTDSKAGARARSKDRKPPS